MLVGSQDVAQRHDPGIQGPRGGRVENEGPPPLGGRPARGGDRIVGHLEDRGDDGIVRVYLAQRLDDHLPGELFVHSGGHRD